MRAATHLVLAATCWACGGLLSFEDTGIITDQLSRSVIRGVCTDPECGCAFDVTAQMKRVPA